MHFKLGDIIPVIGTITTFTLRDSSLAMSLIAALATFIYTALRIIDWVENRIEKKKEKDARRNATV